MKISLIFKILLMTTVLCPTQIMNDGVLFEYNDENVQSVFLVGSMNDWDTNTMPMEKNEYGVWEIFLKLDYGEYLYKFMVDGNWQVDQQNPNFQDDGYGGSNSVIQYNGESDIYENFISKDSGGVKSSFNPKIYFQGRYFSENVFSKDETARFMLDKPEHDLNFGIKIKFNPDFEGYTILNVNNNEEGSEMWRTHFNYKRSYLKLNTDYFNVIAFDNFGIFSFDDPLHIVGDIGYNAYNFGYDFRGLYGQTSNLLSNQIFKSLPISLSGQILLSDRIGYNEDDISAARLKVSSPIFFEDIITFGVSNYIYTTKTSDGLLQCHENSEIDFKYLKEISKKNWTDVMRIEIFGEFSVYENYNDDGMKSIWMDGENLYLGTSIKFPKALEIYANYINSSFELETDFSRDRFTLGSKYNLKKFSWEINLQFWKNNNLDNLSWEDYYKYIEKSDSNGRWFQEHTEVPFEKYTILGYKTGFLWESNINYIFEINNHKIETTLKNKFAHHEILNEPKFIESIFIVDYHLSKDWKLKVDARVPYYNDSFLGLETDFSKNEDVFSSIYSEISYHLSDNIWIALGYGVNPFAMNSVTDELYDRGRAEYLNSVGELPEYLDLYYGGLGDQIRSAEESLMNEKRISIRAIVEF